MLQNNDLDSMINPVTPSKGKFDRIPAEIAAAMGTEVLPPALLTDRKPEPNPAQQRKI